MTVQRSGTVTSIPPKIASMYSTASSPSMSADLKSSSMPPNVAVAVPPVKLFTEIRRSTPPNIAYSLMELGPLLGAPDAVLGILGNSNRLHISATPAAISAIGHMSHQHSLV